MIVESFYSHLRADSGVSAITTSIYPKHLPQHVTKPAITYGVDGDSRQQTLDGASSLKEILFHVDCWSFSEIEAWQLTAAVEAALVGVSGDFGTQSPSDTVDIIRLERPSFDLFEPDTRLYRVSSQFLVAYF
jgi:hypothetical protein